MGMCRCWLCWLQRPLTLALALPPLQVLCATPLLEELKLAGCPRLTDAALVRASMPARPPGLGGEEESDVVELAGEHAFPTAGAALPRVGVPA